MIALQADSDLRIELVSGQQATGRLLSATADGVTLSAGRTDMTVFRGTICRVALLGQRRTARDAKRGFIIEAVAGGLMRTLGTKSNRLPWGAFLAGAWGGIAALIGAVEGFSQRDESVVYVAVADGR